MYTRSAVLLGALALTVQACDVRPRNEVIIEEAIEDLVVEWSIDGEMGDALCDEFGISSWRVVVEGPESDDLDYPCGEWDSGPDFVAEQALPVGMYNIVIEAYDGDQLITQLALPNQRVSDRDSQSPDVISIDFPSADFY